ncbi:MAG: DegT/DnrJ/EryC1/StrS family aminotransferase, partial [Vicinamibacteria bacterium]
RHLTLRTRAIVPVHFAGRPCEMEPLLDLARSRDLSIVEDCAHAIETSYRGRTAGRFGQIGCFSFYATKNVVTGEGGMVLTDDDDIAARIRILALHGMSADAWSRFSDSGYEHYDVVEAGFKYNMMDIQAAMGIHQLKRVEASLSRRAEIWDRYNRAFQGLPCATPRDAEPDTVHARHLYTILVATEELGKSRDWVLRALTAENVGVGVHYRPIPAHPFYQKTFGWSSADFPNAHWVGSRTVSLPLSAALTDGDVSDVVDAVHKVLG